MPDTQLAKSDASTLTPSADAGEWELAVLWRRTWSFVKWAAAAVLALAFLTIIGQGFLYYRLIASAHPLLGVAFVIMLAGLLFVLVGRPLIAYFNTPIAAIPPNAPLNLDAPAQKAMVQRLSYDLKFLKTLQRHPDLQHEREAIAQGLIQGKELMSKVAATPIPDRALAQSVLDFEASQIETQLAPLDEKVDKLIHAEAVRIGVGTAISMNGTVDAFIVLWRSANLIAKISRIYFGRPNLRGSLLIMRDIAAIVVVSRALEDVTSLTGDLIGTLLGKMGGLVAGPVMDGAINAMMALKFGYLTKRRCRAFQDWRPEQAPSISARALERVKKEAGSVVSEIIKACGGLTGAAARATETVMTGSQNAWSTIQSWFGGRKPEGA